MNMKKIGLAAIAVCVFAALAYATARTFTPSSTMGGMKAPQTLIDKLNVGGLGKIGSEPVALPPRWPIIKFEKLIGKDAQGVMQFEPLFVRADHISQISPSHGAPEYEGYTYLTIVEPYTQTTYVKGDPTTIAQLWSAVTRVPLYSFTFDEVPAGTVLPPPETPAPTDQPK
jgi:hypothetical protein